MSEDENYTDINISDIVEDTEQFIDANHHSSEIMVFDTETHTNLHTELDLAPEVINTDAPNQLLVEKIASNPAKVTTKSEVVRLSCAPKLPMGRIKNLMKMDPDVNMVQQDAVYLVTKATEMFLETLANEAYSCLPKNKKTVNKKEIDLAINRVDCLCFLEGAMDF